MDGASVTSDNFFAPCSRHNLEKNSQKPDAEARNVTITLALPHTPHKKLDSLSHTHHHPVSNLKTDLIQY